MISTKDIKHCFKIAERELFKHEQNYKHWTFIFCNSKLIEWGRNTYGTPHIRYISCNSDAQIHSEVTAYKRARGLLFGRPFEILNIRLSNKGLLRLSKPCMVCLGWLHSVKCVGGIYTIDDGLKEFILKD